MNPMSTIGKTIHVKGELRAAEDLTLEGRIEGHVLCEEFAVVLAESADITGNIIARDITVFGRIDGQLVATDVVDVRAAASVTGQIIAERFILNEGGRVHGRVEPQHLEAALRVHRFNQKKRDGDARAG